MVIDTDTGTDRRVPLTKERVLRAAVDLADRGGIEALSMRRLGQELGVDAMALYRHVRNKDDILDGILEMVVLEIEVVSVDDEWTTALRAQVMAARQVMLRHPWTPRVLEERTTMGPAVLAYIERVLGLFHDAGFSLDLAHHAMHVLSSRILGFSQDLFEEEAEPSPEAAAILARTMAAQFPRITEIALAASHEGGLGPCDDDVEFAFGLDLILDGLGRLRVRSDLTGPAPTQ